MSCFHDWSSYKGLARLAGVPDEGGHPICSAPMLGAQNGLLSYCSPAAGSQTERPHVRQIYRMKTGKVILLIAILLAASVGVVYVHRARNVKSSQPCWNKLGQIESAKEQWAIATGATSGTPVTADDIVPYMKAMPTCHVANAQYILGTIGEEPRCTVHGTMTHFKPDRM